ncbi:NHLP bacteriocin system secretion protein [Fusibacter ferrireducens]|uniref:NHLP bacteriocin system secretion protein n=1 Tax=Fusibacter ferrireducens TaxID=2785058 RepID=A0ABR9ZQ59_9FIRM|nr:NHLP bacteriocin system secretion protein [Fusibacter ferrireducens]MBF4692597.1 NHLP bacteriocin system secretion protein [Fusibacter ferrireducens]
MSNQIFRKVALDRLSSPEELDQLITVTNPRGWLALIGIGCILITILIWGILGNVSTQVEGAGLLTTSGGVVSVTHPVSGQVTDVSVVSGDYVKQGDVIARIEQSDLVDVVNQYRDEIKLIETFDVNTFFEDKTSLSANLKAFYDLAREIKQVSASLNVEEATQADNQTTNLYELEQTKIKLKQAQIGIDQVNLNLKQYTADRDEAQKAVERAEVLYNSGALSEKDLESAQLAFQNAQLQMDASALALRTAQSKAASIENDLAMITPPKKIESAQMAEATLRLDQLKAQLEELRYTKLNEMNLALDKAVKALKESTEVVSMSYGQVLEVYVKRGDVIQAGTSLINVARDDREANTLEAVLFVKPEVGKKIHQGMTVHISPTIANVEDYGFMIGEVASVSEYPVSTQYLIQSFGNEQLVQTLTGGLSPIEVHVNLIQDASTFSGYKWSTQKGPNMKIDSGNICSGTIIVDNRRPIEMVIPFVKKKLSIN